MRVSNTTKTALRHSLSFKGRMARAPFWKFVPVGLGLCVLGYLGAQLAGLSLGARLTIASVIAAPLLAAWWRRLQDVNIYGAHAITPWVALAGCLLFGAAAYLLQEGFSASEIAWQNGWLWGLILGIIFDLLALVILGKWIAFLLCLGALALFAMRFSYALSHAILPSTPGPNKYGPNPNEVTS